MVVLEGCRCDDLPAHDHYVPAPPAPSGMVYGVVWDNDDIGRIWVDWREVAHALLRQAVAPDQALDFDESGAGE